MHFEILVEDQSGKIALEAILEKILSPAEAEHTYRIIPYKGIGHIPKKDSKAKSGPDKRIILAQLPRLLRGYGKAYQDFDAAVIVVVDLDERNCMEFKQKMLNLLEQCNPKPNALFRIAIEEMEAWLLGDRNALKTAYPKAKDAVLDTYGQDSICGTWEKMADAIFPGGAKKLKQKGFPHTGVAKCEWAQNIAPHMDVDNNASPSFQVFRDGIRKLADITG